MIYVWSCFVVTEIYARVKSEFPLTACSRGVVVHLPVKYVRCVGTKTQILCCYCRVFVLDTFSQLARYIPREYYFSRICDTPSEVGYVVSVILYMLPVETSLVCVVNRIGGKRLPYRTFPTAGLNV